MEYPIEDQDEHEIRRRRAHIAEILATKDWTQYGSGDRPETIPDLHFAERKARYTRDGGRNAPWSTGDAAAIGDRIREPGTIAHLAYYQGLMPSPESALTEDERAAIRERVKRRREQRKRNG